MAEDVASSLGKFDYQQLARPDQFDGELAQSKVRDVLGRATAIEAAVGSEADKAAQDDRLSDLGKREAARDAAKKYADDIQRLEADVAEIDGRRRKALEAMAEDLPDASDPAQAVREREIRDALRQMDRGQVVKLYRDAGLNGDLETVAAIERAPKSLAIVDADTIARERQSRMERAFPDQAARVKNMEAVHDTLASATAYLRRRLGMTG